MRRRRWTGICVAALLGAMLTADRTPGALIAADDFLTTTDGAGDTYSTVGGHSSKGSVCLQSPAAGVVGFDGATAWITGGNNTDQFQVEVGGLTHPLTARPPSAEDGRAFSTDQTHDRLVRRALDAGARAAMGEAIAADGDLWMSALVMAPELITGATDMWMLMGMVGAATTTTAPADGVAAGIAGDEIRLYYRDSTGSYTSALALSEAAMQAGTTYLLTVRIEFDAAGDNERITLNVYDPDDPPASPSGTVTVAEAAVDPATDLLSVALSKDNLNYADSASTPRFDAFRLGGAQADVMVAPEPGSAALALAGVAWVALRRRRPARPA